MTTLEVPNSGAPPSTTPMINDPSPADGMSPMPEMAEPEKPKIKIDANKDLWQNIAANVKEATEGQTDQTVLVVGARGAGKTSLIHRLLASNKATVPTTALEYSYGKREERNHTNIAHLWELAQGSELAQLSDVVITGENIHSAVLTIVVDCANPGTVWETLHYWLMRMDRRVQETFGKMRAKGNSTPDKLLQKAKKRIGEDHPDIGQMRISGVPVVIVANRLDKFKGELPKLKTLCRTLRFMAHTYGASLAFTTTENERETHKFLALWSHMIFGAAMDQKHVQFDPERGGVLVPAGADNFKEIGEPGVGRPRDFVSCGDSDLDRWKGPLDETFEPVAASAGKGSESEKQREEEMKQFEEPAIDAMRKQKDDELEQYRRNAAKKAQEAKEEARERKR